MGTVTLQSLDAHALEQAAHGRSVGFQYMPGAVPWREAGLNKAVQSMATSVHNKICTLFCGC